MCSKRFFLSAVFCLAAFSCAFAQGEAAAVINDIKRSKVFLYAECTDSDWEKASENATIILIQIVNDKISESGLEITVSDVLKDKIVIRTSRESFQRAFVYVPDPFTAEIQGQTEIEKSMLSISDFDQIRPFISGLQDKGILLDYGKYATLPESEAFLFVYSREGKIVAILKNNSDGQINISTGHIDDIRNYKGCGAIWFRTK